jgi:hypothetical protein
MFGIADLRSIEHNMPLTSHLCAAGGASASERDPVGSGSMRSVPVPTGPQLDCSVHVASLDRRLEHFPQVLAVYGANQVRP